MVELLAKHALPRLRYDVTGPVDQLLEELDTPDVSADTGRNPGPCAQRRVGLAAA